MELKEFIKKTLVDIVEGVELAQNSLKNKNCIINPLRTGNYSSDTGLIKKLSETNDANIDFEVVLSQTESEGGKVGLGVWFANIGLGGQTKTDESISSVTSVRFSVPIRFTKGE